jgi:Mrp family chromosome partitioning ATPase
MASLLAEVRSTFDFAVIDCPPVLGLADCLAVLPLVDAVLLVVKAGRTRGGAIIEAVDQLERVGVSVDAAIMNDVRVRRGRPGHHAYGYYRASDTLTLPNEPEPPVLPRLAPSPHVSSVPNENGAVSDVERSKRGPRGAGERSQRETIA